MTDTKCKHCCIVGGKPLCNIYADYPFDQECESHQDCYFKQLQKTDAMLSRLNEELLKIVEPRMSDFTGYDEETNSFDIVLAIKEIIEDLEDIGK